MSAHALFAPSASERWIACPGSVALTEHAPRTSSSFADEGTAAHEVASRCLLDGIDVKDCDIGSIEVNGATWQVTDEMRDAVQLYLDEVRGRVLEGHHLFVERRVSFGGLIGVEGQFGTADAIILSEDGTKVTVADLKYGRGVRVNAEENTQLMTYAAAVVLESFASLMDGVEEVTLLIVQPRLDHVDEWTLPVARLRQHVEQMRLAVSHAHKARQFLALEKRVPIEFFTPTEKGCRFCPASATCEALQRKVAAAVFDDFQALDEPEALLVAPPPVLPDSRRLGQTFGVLDLIESWCRSVRGEVERRIAGGMTVIGPDGLPMKMIEGRKGRRAWQDAETAEAVLQGLLTPDKLYEPREIISPAKAEKMLGKKATRAQWDDMIVPLIVQGAGSPKVALGSDPAPPYTGTASADEFGNLNED